MARILVIDDSSDVRQIVADLLEGDGHEVLQASNGAAGVEMQRRARASLVITDILMPEKPGVETIVELKKEFPDLPVIVMSGGSDRFSSANLLFTAKTFGADDVLAKPFHPDKLLRVVRAALTRNGAGS